MDQNTVYIDDSAKEILKENMYSGTGYINTKEELSTAGSFAKMQVSGADTIIPENIKENETILGVTGSYEGVPTKQYIYEKGEDSVGFDLYTPSGSDYDYVDLGTNLIPGNDYEIWGLDWAEYDLYINDIFIKTGSNAIPFTLTEDMSVNNKVVITVKRHE